MLLTTATLTLISVTFEMISVNCVPKYDESFVPSPIDYLEKLSKDNDQIAMPSQIQEEKGASSNAVSPQRYASTDSNDTSDHGQKPRFGFTNVGGTASGYGVSTYGPGKIDLGGLLLGAVIGVGTILIIPKLLYILSGSYGSYARSEDGSYAQMMNRLDEVLARHGIDTTSCIQRIVCSYTRQAAETMRLADSVSRGEDAAHISTVDKMIDGLSTNQILHAALRGTAIQDAIDSGRAGQNCARVYYHCPFTTETVLSLLSSIMSSAGTSDARSTDNVATASTNLL